MSVGPCSLCNLQIWPNKLHYIRLERLARDKHCSLLGLFVSYGENEDFCKLQMKKFYRIGPRPMTAEVFNRLTELSTSLGSSNIPTLLF